MAYHDDKMALNWKTNPETTNLSINWQEVRS